MLEAWQSILNSIKLFTAILSAHCYDKSTPHRSRNQFHVTFCTHLGCKSQFYDVEILFSRFSTPLQLPPRYEVNHTKCDSWRDIRVYWKSFLMKTRMVEGEEGKMSSFPPHLRYVFLSLSVIYIFPQAMSRYESYIEKEWEIEFARWHSVFFFRSSTSVIGCDWRLKRATRAQLRPEIVIAGKIFLNPESIVVIRFHLLTQLKSFCRASSKHAAIIKLNLINNSLEPFICMQRRWQISLRRQHELCKRSCGPQLAYYWICIR